jgi:hypothetical protein
MEQGCMSPTRTNSRTIDIAVAAAKTSWTLQIHFVKGVWRTLHNWGRGAGTWEIVHNSPSPNPTLDLEILGMPSRFSK